MTKNLGNTDRIIRIVLAIVFAILYYNGTVSGTLGITLLVLGGIFLVTALMGWCGIYAIFGLKTCPSKS